MITPFLPASAVPARSAATEYDVIDSPVGRLLLTGALPANAVPANALLANALLAKDVPALTGLYMLDAGVHSAAVQPGWTRRAGGFAEAAAQLAAYFAGERTEFDLPLAPRGTPFQLAVWEQLTRIPYGKTVSYGEVAAALGKSPVASRAVGLANGRNPISIIIPCHRVIGADGSLTGYGWGLDRKEWLLRHEGALGGAAAPAALW